MLLKPEELNTRPLVKGITPDESHRTDVYAVTIDSTSTKDRDDAIHIERRGKNTRISVHVADAPHYIIKDSDLDKYAYKQGETFYLPGNKCMHMLTTALAENKISLTEGERRRTVSVIMDVNEHFDLKNVEIKETWLHCEKNLSYQDVEKAVENNDQQMKFWCAVAQALYTKRRNRAGKFEFNQAENLYYDENGKPLLLCEGSRKAYMLIEETMLLANHAVALYADQNKIPVPYRNHQYALNEEYIENDFYASDSEVRYIDDFSYNAYYSEKPEGHEGLGTSHYLHYTSPIRRYPDIIVMRQIKTHLYNQRHPEAPRAFSYTLDDIKQKTSDLNTTLRENRHRIAMKARAYYKKRDRALLNGYHKKDKFSEMDIGSLQSTLMTVFSSDIENNGFREALIERLENKDLPIKFLNTLIHDMPRKNKFWKPVANAVCSHLENNPHVSMNLLSLSELEKQDWKIVHKEHQRNNSICNHIILMKGYKQLASPHLFLSSDRKEAKQLSATNFIKDYINDRLVNADDSVIRHNDNPSKQTPVYTVFSEKADVLLEKVATHMNMPIKHKSMRSSGNDWQAYYSLPKNKRTIMYSSGHGSTRATACRVAAYNFLQTLKDNNVLTNSDIVKCSSQRKEFIALARELGEKQGWTVKQDKAPSSRIQYFLTSP